LPGCARGAAGAGAGVDAAAVVAAGGGVARVPMNVAGAPLSTLAGADAGIAAGARTVGATFARLGAGGALLTMRQLAPETRLLTYCGMPSPVSQRYSVLPATGKAASRPSVAMSPHPRFTTRSFHPSATVAKCLIVNEARGIPVCDGDRSGGRSRYTAAPFAAIRPGLNAAPPDTP